MSTFSYFVSDSMFLFLISSRRVPAKDVMSVEFIFRKYEIYNKSLVK